MNTNFDTSCTAWQSPSQFRISFLSLSDAIKSLDQPPPPACDVCHKTEDTDTKIKRCSRCHDRFYCGKTCQQSDWKAHKPNCVTREIWYDKYRKCKDGTVHYGKLQLITWGGERDGHTLGWGASFENDSEALQKILEEGFKGDLQRFHAWRPQAFRWTCCGTSASMDYGCDHHGAGPMPCTCDFCRMGKSIPDKFYYERLPSKVGLHLPRGPDPRSYSAAFAAQAAAGRKKWNMDG
ncbi:hypothetical protein GALMADRAFT_66014 [Galerina marginata CBS 339.88]|uniref:MYND-type domain-containing protein n=1 Tax=Galerina marginata (strain CBS 339.88) TaxID=685588 RepID=A0A067T3B1_GALM3|nr:hypothetical protein GALMADRAFT_66014 [Galerina marginata CBS 339.88]